MSVTGLYYPLKKKAASAKFHIIQFLGQRRHQLLRESGKVNEVHSVFPQQKPVTIFHMKESLPL